MENGLVGVFPVDAMLNAQGFIGLTKRELFAAMAMQAVIPVLFSGVKIKDTSLNGESLAAAQAVEYADALLAALEGKGS